MNLKSKILQYGIGPVGSVIISLVTLPFIAWFYTINDVARFSIFQAILLFYTLVLSFGLDQAFIREYYEAKNKNELLKNIGFGLLVPNIFFIFAVLYFFWDELSYLIYDEVSFSLIMLTVASCFFSLLIRILSSIQRVNDQAILFSLSQIIPKFLFIILLIIFTYVFPPDFINIIVAQFFALMAVFLYFLMVNKVYIKESIKEKIDINLVKSYVIYGFPLIFTGILIWGLKIADRFYLKAFSDLKQLGLYSMAISIAGAVGIFVSIFNTIWSPLVYRWVKEENIYSTEIVSKVEKIAFLGSISILIISIITILGAYLVPYFLPNDYNKIYLILPSCVLSVLVFTLSEVTSIGINLMRKTKYTLFSCIIAIIFHVLTSILLIPVYGSTGAALAGLIAFYVFYILKTYFSNMIWVKNNFNNVHLLVFLSIILVCLPVVYGY